MIPYGAPGASTCAGHDHVYHMTTLPLARDQGTQCTPAPGYIPARVSSPARALIGSAFNQWAIMSHLLFWLMQLSYARHYASGHNITGMRVSEAVRVGTLDCISKSVASHSITE